MDPATQSVIKEIDALHESLITYIDSLNKNGWTELDEASEIYIRAHIRKLLEFAHSKNADIKEAADRTAYDIFEYYRDIQDGALWNKTMIKDVLKVLYSSGLSSYAHGQEEKFYEAQEKEEKEEKGEYMSESNMCFKCHKVISP